MTRSRASAGSRVSAVLAEPSGHRLSAAVLVAERVAVGRHLRLGDRRQGLHDRLVDSVVVLRRR
ncbi:hypothetical protein [Streptomyces aurantiogriseus]|nr:hypothetical protein [Streptomyces aurantiogriseus]